MNAQEHMGALEIIHTVGAKKYSLKNECPKAHRTL